MFGGEGGSIDISIDGNSNENSDSQCFAKGTSFSLPTAENGDEDSSIINGGKVYFTSKELEVYRVYVSSIYHHLTYFIGEMKKKMRIH